MISFNLIYSYSVINYTSKCIIYFDEPLPASAVICTDFRMSLVMHHYHGLGEIMDGGGNPTTELQISFQIQIFCL